MILLMLYVICFMLYDQNDGVAKNRITVAYVPAGCRPDIFAFMVIIASWVVVRGTPVRAGAAVRGIAGVGVISAVTFALCIIVAGVSAVSLLANGRKYELLIKSVGTSCPVIP